MNIVHFGTDSEYIKIIVPDSYSEEGWAQVEVEISVNGFNGKITPWVEAIDFQNFSKSLRALYETLNGTAEFLPIERQFTLKLTSGTGGRVELTGVAWSQATFENKLAFVLQIDQSYLMSPLKVIERLAIQGAVGGA